MGYFASRKNRQNRKRRLIIRQRDRGYLIYERKLTESGLSRWVVLCSSDDDSRASEASFKLKDENITILSDNILSISIEGIKLSKDNAEIWLMYNCNIVRSYTERRKHRLHWVKITYAGKFKSGDILSIGSDGIGDIQVSIMCLGT